MPWLFIYFKETKKGICFLKFGKDTSVKIKVEVDVEDGGQYGIIIFVWRAFWWVYLEMNRMEKEKGNRWIGGV